MIVPRLPDDPFECLRRMPWPAVVTGLIFLFGQLIALVIWGANITSDIHSGQARDAEMKAKIEALDQHGTRRLEIIEDRQNNVLRRLDANERALHNIEQVLRAYTHPN